MSTRDFGRNPLNFNLMPPVIRTLIIANVVLYLFKHMIGGEFVGIFGLVPAKVVNDAWVWQLFTYLFLHGNFFHLLFNMFGLWMFGMAVESQWGPREFLKYFLICGVGAGLCSVLVDLNSNYAIIGASGAIYGLLVAFAMLYPDAVVYMYFFFPMKAKHMALLYGVVEFMAGTADARPATARFAHLGGMVVGYVYIRWWWLLKLRLQTFFRGLSGVAEAGTAARRRPAARAASPAARDEMAEVDRILDKILAQGEASLTEAERETLKRQSRSKPHPEGHA